MTKSVRNVFYIFLHLFSVTCGIFSSGNGADSKIHISVHISKSAVCPYIYLEPEFEILPNLILYTTGFSETFS